MKHKGIYRIVPFLLAVLLISSGLVLPRLMIKRLKTQLLQDVYKRQVQRGLSGTGHQKDRRGIEKCRQDCIIE